jgi:hypothetical protein
VSVVEPVPPDARTTLAVEDPVEPNPADTLTEPEAETTAVPAYPPAEVSVIVEVPLFPGFGEEMVTLVALRVILGLVTVTVVVPVELAL